MTWQDFTTQVDNHLVTDANRRGLEAFRARYMQDAVINLQRYIPSYRVGNTTIYGPGDVTAVGCASLATFPSCARPSAVYIYSTCAGDDPNVDRYRLDFYPWKDRQDLVGGRLDFQSWWWNCFAPSCQSGPPPTCPAAADWPWAHRKGYVYTIGPHGTNFLVYPALTAETSMLLIWDGIKSVFGQSDIVPFPDASAEAVSQYIKWQILAQVDKNPTLAEMAQKRWLTCRLELYRDWQETQEMEKEDDEYAGSFVPTTAFASFGAQQIPLLRTITTLAGTTNAALAAIPTVGLDTPASVFITIGGIEQLWTLSAVTTPTGAGAQQPNDYNAALPKVWILSG